MPPSTYYIPTLRSSPQVVRLLGDVTFVPSLDPTVTNYTGRVYASGTTTPILATQNFGLPKAVGGTITVNMFATLSALPPGTYDVTVVATSPGGSAESVISNVFSDPLIPA